jgi:hypothetical protein
MPPKNCIKDTTSDSLPIPSKDPCILSRNGPKCGIAVFLIILTTKMLHRWAQYYFTIQLTKNA